MNVETHLLVFNEEDILPYTLRHYASFCDKIVVHDAFSTDKSRDIARHYGAEIRDWHCIGVNDLIAKRTKEEAVMLCKADWCIVVDADELIYFPLGAFHTLAVYEADGVAIVRTKGYEMFADEFPNTEQQIYDVVKMGSPDFKWYSKAVLVAPRLIKFITFGAGCHQTWAKLSNGSTWDNILAPSDPECLLLHYHHLGGLGRVGRRYAGQQSRHSQTNIAKRYGNFEDPDKHARDKHDAIVANLRQVI